VEFLYCDRESSRSHETRSRTIRTGLCSRPLSLPEVFRSQKRATARHPRIPSLASIPTAISGSVHIIGSQYRHDPRSRGESITVGLRMEGYALPPQQARDHSHPLPAYGFRPYRAERRRVISAPGRPTAESSFSDPPSEQLNPWKDPGHCPPSRKCLSNMILTFPPCQSAPVAELLLPVGCLRSPVRSGFTEGQQQSDRRAYALAMWSAARPDAVARPRFRKAQVLLGPDCAFQYRRHLIGASRRIHTLFVVTV